MTSIAFISPKGNIFGKSKAMSDFIESTPSMESFKYLWTGPNLGLLTIAAYTPQEWSCEYIDENYREIDFNKAFDIVCISAMTQQAVRAYEIAESFRKKGALTVIGGIHATILPHEAGEYADVVIAGEGEVLWPLFIEDYKRNSVKSCYREEVPGQYGFDNPKVPKYELIKDYDYPIVTLQTTRGCPHDCSFCCASKIFGAAYRRKSNSDILKELLEIQRYFSDVLILFADDNLFVKRKETKELLKEIARLHIRWIAQTDISIAEDTELLELMVYSGCQWIVIGFESTSLDSLQNLDSNNWKLKQLPKYSERIEKIHSYGIHIYGTFIVGLDNDSKEIFDATSDFIRANKLYGANITVPTPLPGTRLRESLAAEGRITNGDWSYYTFWDVNIKPQNMLAGELEEGLLRIYRSISNTEASAERMIHLKKAAKRRRELIKKIRRSLEGIG